MSLDEWTGNGIFELRLAGSHRESEEGMLRAGFLGKLWLVASVGIQVCCKCWLIVEELAYGDETTGKKQPLKTFKWFASWIYTVSDVAIDWKLVRKEGDWETDKELTMEVPVTWWTPWRRQWKWKWIGDTDPKGLVISLTGAGTCNISSLGF